MGSTLWACVIIYIGLTDGLSTCRGFVIHLAIPGVNGLISVASHKYGPLLVGCLACLIPRWCARGFGYQFIPRVMGKYCIYLSARLKEQM